MSELVKAFHTGNSVVGDWFSGAIRDTVGLLEFEDITRTWEKGP
jgi:hypothetical protein